MAPNFYRQKDKERGYIIGKDRQGKTKKIPFISISIGIVNNEKKKITHVAQVGEIGAELKEYAKSLKGSTYVTERRKTS